MPIINKIIKKISSLNGHRLTKLFISHELGRGHVVFLTSDFSELEVKSKSTHLQSQQLTLENRNFVTWS